MHAKSGFGMLKIFLEEDKVFENRLVYRELIDQAKRMEIRSVSVFKGEMGYGRDSLIHSSMIVRLSEGLPVMLELVDDKERLERYLRVVHHFFRDSGFVLMDSVEMVDGGGFGSRITGSLGTLSRNQGRSLPAGKSFLPGGSDRPDNSL